MHNFLIRYHISYIKASKRFLIALQWWVLIYLLIVALLYIGLLRSIMSVYKWQNMLMMKCSCDLLQFLKRSVLNVKKKTLQKIARKLFSITVRLYKRLLLYCAASKNNVLCSLLCHSLQHLNILQLQDCLRFITHLASSFHYCDEFLCRRKPEWFNNLYMSFCKNELTQFWEVGYHLTTKNERETMYLLAIRD